MSINWRQLQRDAGGKWLAYFPPYLLLLPVWLVSSVLLLVDSGSAEELRAATVANLLGLACAAGELGLLREYRRRVKPTTIIPLGIVVLCGGIMGGTKTIVMTWVYCAWIPDLSLGEELVQRLPATVILGMWLIPTLAIVFSILERYQLEKQALVTTLVKSSRPANNSDSPESAHYFNMLRALVHRTREKLASAQNNPQEISAVLTELASSDVRNLSHTIWNDQNQRFSNFTLQDLVRTAITKHRYPVMAIALAYVLYTAPAQMFYVGAGEALSRMAVQALILCGVFGVAKWLRTTTFSAGVTLFVSSTVLATFLIMTVTTSIFGPLGSINQVVVTVVLLTTLATTTLIFSLINLVVVSHKEIESELSRMLSQKELELIRRGAHQLADRKLANYLHGYVQSRFVASAMRINHSSREEIHSTVEQERHAIEELLREVESHNSIDPLSIGEEARMLSEEWSKLAQITWDIHDQVLTDHNPAHIRRRSDACREAVTNAVRHGMATEICIILTSDVLEVTDNGTGPRNGSPGMGSALFSSLGDDEIWSLTPGTTAGSHLRVPLRCD